MTVTHLPTHLEPDPSALTGPDLAQRAGISYRQLDHWTRVGYLIHIPRPDNAGSGTPRSYPATELPVARLMGQLIADGLNPGPAHAAARDLLEHGHTTLAGIRIDLPQDL